MKKGYKAGLLLGGLIGGALLALSKTKKGKEITKKAKDELEDLYAKLGSQIVDLGDATREAYDEAIDAMVDLYAKNKHISANTRDYLAEELKKRWYKLQVRALYADLKVELAGAVKMSRKNFDLAADKIARQYAKEKSLTKAAALEMSRDLKDRWEEFKTEMSEK